MNIRTRLLMAGALIAAASAAGAQTPAQSAPSLPAYEIQQANDQRITRDVEAKIASDPRLDGIVQVETEKGVVTLTGLVTTDGQADRAGRDAESVKGVSEVDDQVNALVGKNF